MRKPHDVLRDTSDQDMQEPRSAVGGRDDEIDLVVVSIPAYLLRRPAHRDLRFKRDAAEIDSVYEFPHSIVGCGTRLLGRGEERYGSRMDPWR